MHLSDATHDWGYRVFGSTSGAGANNCDCTCSTVYINIENHVAEIEKTENIDVTPCTDTAGNWAPSADCKAFQLKPQEGTGSFPACGVPVTQDAIDSCGMSGMVAAGSGGASGASAGAGGRAGASGFGAAGSGGRSGAGGLSAGAGGAAGASGRGGAGGINDGAAGAGLRRLCGLVGCRASGYGAFAGNRAAERGWPRRDRHAHQWSQRIRCSGQRRGGGGLRASGIRERRTDRSSERRLSDRGCRPWRCVRVGAWSALGLAAADAWRTRRRRSAAAPRFA